MARTPCQSSGTLIPLYSYDGEFQDHITLARAKRLENGGHVRMVRHRKGSVNRAILLRRESDPRPSSLRDYQGEAYSIRQPLPSARRPWKLRPLQGGKSETRLAPPELRPIFLNVLMECSTD
jgi:hypothetical protein